MLFNRRRVDEDLERIRKANLTPEKQAEEARREEELRQHQQDNKLEKGDLLAMFIAFLSVIGPYILIFIGIIAALVLLMALLFR